jgi:hypothetical protein
MKTKRIIPILIAAAMIIMPACDDFLAELLKLDTEWVEMKFYIDPDDQVGLVEFDETVHTLGLDSLLEAHGYSRENIESIKVKQIKAYVLTNGFVFNPPLSSMEFHLETPANPMLDPVKVAWLDPVPTDTTMVELEKYEDDLQEYIMEDLFHVSARGNLLSQVGQSVELQANIRFVIRFKSSETE